MAALILARMDRCLRLQQRGEVSNMSDSQQPLYLTALTPFWVIRSSQVHVPLSLTVSVSCSEYR